MRGLIPHAGLRAGRERSDDAIILNDGKWVTSRPSMGDLGGDVDRNRRLGQERGRLLDGVAMWVPIRTHLGRATPAGLPEPI